MFDNKSVNEINQLFNELYSKLTAATVRAELGDLSEIARAVDAAHHDFAEAMLDKGKHLEGWVPPTADKAGW